MHRIAVLALPGVVPSDLATPCDLFDRVRTADGLPAYEVRVCGLTERVDAVHFHVQAKWRLGSLRRAQTVIVPGLHDPRAKVSAQALRALQAASLRGARIVSICTGAFVLAAAGLLDGKRATTHWMSADLLQRLYPGTEVDASVLYVDSSNVLTSAGAAAGLDLCLHLVRRDHGEAIAAMAARMAVMPLGREGGQAQFIQRPLPKAASSSLQPLLSQVTPRLDQAWDLARLARTSGLSQRTLHRRFLEQVGTSPLQWLRSARVQRVRELLETSDLSVEKIVDLSGFGSSVALRRHFSQDTGTSPLRYREAFGRRRD